MNSKAPIWVKKLVDAISNGLITEMQARDALSRVERTHPNLVGVEALFDIEMSNVMLSQNDVMIPPPNISPQTDWETLYNREHHDEWLVRGLWPLGRQIHIHAERKTGKSLVALWMAANISMGRDPFSGESIEPLDMMYLDFEMTEDDLLERVEDMGFVPNDLKRLHYLLHPTMPKFDTPEGGQALMTHIAWYDCKAVMIDTVSRVVAGDENSNDTYIRMFNHTGALLKAANISMGRLDHEGHSNGRSRGASAKADDVDLIWQLKETEEGYDFIRKAARISWVPETIPLKKVVEPTLAFKRAIESWPAGTKEKADQLDKCNVPIDATKRAATNALKAAGFVGGRAEVITAALRFRKMRNVIPPQ